MALALAVACSRRHPERSEAPLYWLLPVLALTPPLSQAEREGSPVLAFTSFPSPTPIRASKQQPPDGVSKEMPDPHDPTSAHPDAPQFLSTGALQDPTLRTPGSQIPDSIYAASDSKSFHLRNLSSAPSSREHSRRALALILAFLLLAILLATAVPLYRDTHRSGPHAQKSVFPRPDA